MGCFAQEGAERLLSFGADIVIGTEGRKDAVGLIEAFKKDHKKRVAVGPVRPARYEELGAFAFTSQTRAYLKIQDGCDKFCSYCLIPTLRGASRSRNPSEAREEAKRFVEAGYKEIVLTGIDVGSYGHDLGPDVSLSGLIRDILDDNPTLCRLRLSSLDESDIDDDFLRLLRDRPTIASHLHLSLQSGSASVLKRMRRHYTPESFLSKVAAIREARPDIAITTDIIAGFPGETDEEWSETVRFVRKARLAEIHVFPYSRRPRTLAGLAKDQIDPETKSNRVHEILALSKELRLQYESRFYGKPLEVLYEDYDPKLGLAYGHTSNYLLVKTPSEKPLHGEIREVIYSKDVAAD
jgi:threonylcarbamoyladenosine tRNA methylthiotransferase MtaB